MKQWIVAEHKGWGDNIGFDRTHNDYRPWCGHTTPAPEIGDTFVTEMNSGLFGEFTVIEVRREYDPPDMWHAKTERGGRIYEPPVLEHEDPVG